MSFKKFVTGFVTFGLLVVCLLVGAGRAEKLLVGYSGISADLSHLWKPVVFPNNSYGPENEESIHA